MKIYALPNHAFVRYLVIYDLTRWAVEREFPRSNFIDYEYLRSILFHRQHANTSFMQRYFKFSLRLAIFLAKKLFHDSISSVRWLYPTQPIVYFRIRTKRIALTLIWFFSSFLRNVKSFSNLNLARPLPFPYLIKTCRTKNSPKMSFDIENFIYANIVTGSNPFEIPTTAETQYDRILQYRWTRTLYFSLLFFIEWKLFHLDRFSLRPDPHVWLFHQYTPYSASN